MVFAQVQNKIPDICDALGIETIGGFVQNNQSWIVNKGNGYSESLFHSLGESFHFAMCPVCQIYQFQLFHQSCFGNFYSTHACKKRDILVGTEIFIEVGSFYYRSNLLKDLPPM